MNQNSLFFKKATIYSFCFMLFFVWSCAPTRPLPQPHKVEDPSNVPGAVHDARWDIAAVGYVYPDQGLDYAEAGVYPVNLVFRNKSGDSPMVSVVEARGVSPDGEYLTYSVEEATRLVFASETFSNTAYNTGKSALLLGALGAGMGALLGWATGGGTGAWKGAIVGGGLGVLGGMVATLPAAEQELGQVVAQELSQYAWTDEAVPSMSTKVGYLYLPADVGIHSVKITVRTGSDILTYTVPVAMPDGSGGYQGRAQETGDYDNSSGHLSAPPVVEKPLDTSATQGPATGSAGSGDEYGLGDWEDPDPGKQ